MLNLDEQSELINPKTLNSENKYNNHDINKNITLNQSSSCGLREDFAGLEQFTLTIYITADANKYCFVCRFLLVGYEG